MPLLNGSLSARIWRVTEALPPRFNEIFDRNLQRHAFKPVDTEKGNVISIGWTNIRHVLEPEVRLEDALTGGVIALGMRIDRISINPRIYKARLAQEIDKVLRQKNKERLTDDQRQVIEQKVKQELLLKQPPSMSIYEMGWHLEQGLVFFGSSGNKVNQDFADLFAETFNVGLEPQFPYYRAQKFAAKQRLDHELREALPSAFSPRAPAMVVEVEQDGGEE